MTDYPKIPEEAYNKAKGQLRLQLNRILAVYDGYGMNIYKPQVIDAILEVAEQFGKRIRGKDVPIVLRKNKYLPERLM